jgi:hypothetical protein
MGHTRGASRLFARELLTRLLWVKALTTSLSVRCGHFSRSVTPVRAARATEAAA